METLRPIKPMRTCVSENELIRFRNSVHAFPRPPPPPRPELPIRLESDLLSPTDALEKLRRSIGGKIEVGGFLAKGERRSSERSGNGLLSSRGSIVDIPLRNQGAALRKCTSFVSRQNCTKMRIRTAIFATLALVATGYYFKPQLLSFVGSASALVEVDPTQL